MMATEGETGLLHVLEQLSTHMASEGAAIMEGADLARVRALREEPTAGGTGIWQGD